MLLLGHTAPPAPTHARPVRNLTEHTPAPTEKKKDQRDNLLNSSKLRQRRAERIERQQKVEAYICAHPGKTFEELKFLFNVVYSVLYVDLRELTEAGRISASRYKQITRWGPPGYYYMPPAEPNQRKPRVPLGELLLKELHGGMWLTTTHLMRAMSQHDISRGNLIAALQRLRHKGLVEWNDTVRPAQWRRRGEVETT